MIIVFFTAYIKDEDTADDSTKIACHYLKGWFWIDLIAIFPFQLVIPRQYYNADDGGSGGFGFIRLSKVNRMTKFFKMMKLARYIKIF